MVASLALGGGKVASGQPFHSHQDSWDSVVVSGQYMPNPVTDSRYATYAEVCIRFYVKDMMWCVDSLFPPEKGVRYHTDVWPAATAHKLNYGEVWVPHRNQPIPEWVYTANGCGVRMVVSAGHARYTTS